MATELPPTDAILKAIALSTSASAADGAAAEQLQFLVDELQQAQTRVADLEAEKLSRAWVLETYDERVIRLEAAGFKNVRSGAENCDRCASGAHNKNWHDRYGY